MTKDTVHYLDARGPEGIRLYVIGDVHGCIGLLRSMHEKIMSEIVRDGIGDWRVVLVGDYCDRGPDVKATIDFLIELCLDPRVVALQGNHDQRFLAFLDAPDHADHFLQLGGAETARSYGVVLDIGTPALLHDSHQALVKSVPETHKRFFRTLRLIAEFGDFFICHAGIRPGVPLEAQRSDDLVWIRSEFLDYPGLHPKIVVHGHTVCDRPEVMPNRVNVDTGAVWTGVLTALVIDGPEKRFIEVRGRP